MQIPPEILSLVELGITAILGYFLYDIARNHLGDISKTQEEIIRILKRIEDKL